MKCPECQCDIEPRAMKVCEDAEEDGIEVGFDCPGCGQYLYAVLKPDSFIRID